MVIQIDEALVKQYLDKTDDHARRIVQLEQLVEQLAARAYEPPAVEKTEEPAPEEPAPATPRDNG